MVTAEDKKFNWDEAIYWEEKHCLNDRVRIIECKLFENVKLII